MSSLFANSLPITGLLNSTTKTLDLASNYCFPITKTYTTLTTLNSTFALKQ